MVAIPGSPGITQRPTTQTGRADVNLSAGQILPNAIGQLGGQIESAALQFQQQKNREEEAFNAAQVLGFKTQLSKFDNEAELAFKDIPASDIETTQDKYKSFLENRKKFITQQSEQFKDNPRLAGLVEQQAELSSVDFEDNLATQLSNKKREYGQGKAYERIYNINTRIATGGSVDAARRDLKETLDISLASGLLDMKDVIREQEKQQQIIKERQKEVRELQIYNSTLNGSIILDPNSKQAQKAVDLLFSQQSANKTPEQLQRDAHELSLKQGIIPTQYKSILTGTLRLGDPIAKVSAAQQVIDLVKHSNNPQLASQFTSDDLKIIYAMEPNLYLNLPADQVVKLAEDEVNVIKNRTREQRLAVFNEKDFKTLRDSGYEQFTEHFTDQPGIDLFQKDVTIPESVIYGLPPKAEFDRRVQNNLSAGFTKEGAVNDAISKMKAEYGVTEIGKKRIQRGAPEQFYKRYNTGNGWIKEQLAQEVGKHIDYPSQKAMVKDIETNYSVEPIPETLIAGKPEYYILRSPSPGAPIDFLFDADNQRVRFKPDYSLSKQAREQDKEQKKLNASTERDALERVFEEQSKKAAFRGDISKSRAITLGISPEQLKK